MRFISGSGRQPHIENQQIFVILEGTSMHYTSRPVRRLIAATAIIMGPLPAMADPIAALKEAAADGPVYAFDMAYEIAGVRAEGSVDPTQPEGQRITIRSPAQEDWPDGFADTVADLDKDAEGDIWCADFAESIPDNAELTSETADTLTFTFSPTADEDADRAEKKIFENLVATAVIARDTPSILSFQMHLPEPVKPNIMAKITAFQMFAQCEPSPDGRTYISDLTFEVAGSALGQSFSETTRQQITRLFPPANPAR